MGWSPNRRKNEALYAVLGLMATQSVMVLRYLAENPIFQQFQSADFNQHVAVTLDVLHGTYPTSPSSNILYSGVHHILALALSVTGGEPIVVIRYVMAGMTILAVPLLYLAAKAAFSSKTAAFFSASIYSLTGTLWFGLVFNSGLFPQLYGFIAANLLIIATLNLARTEKHLLVNALFLLVTLVNALYSHYSVLFVFPPLVLVTAYEGVTRPENRRRCEFALAVLVLPVALGVAEAGSLLSVLLGFLVGNAGGVVGTTPLASWLSPVPVLSFVAVEVTSEPGALILLALALVSIGWLWRKPGTLLAPVWAAGVFLLAPFNASAWRFSFIALIPVTMMAGAGLALIVQAAPISKRRIGAVALVCLFMGGMMYGSWGLNALFTNIDQQPQFQNDILSAMHWLRANTPADSLYYSVTDWRFTYMTLTYRMETFYQFTSSQSQALNFLSQKVDSFRPLNRTFSAQFMIVTYFVTNLYSANPSDYPWNTFSANGSLSLIYSNPDVEVFRVALTS